MSSDKMMICSAANKCPVDCMHGKPHKCNSRCETPCQRDDGVKGATCEPVPEDKIPYEATSTESVTVKKQEPQLYICDKHETCGSPTCEHKFSHSHVPQCNVNGCSREDDCECVPYTPPAQIYAHLHTRLQAIEQQLDEVLKQRQNPQIRVTGEAADKLRMKLRDLVIAYHYIPADCVERLEQVLSEYGFNILPHEEE